MAHLSERGREPQEDTDDGRDRGQLLLVAVLILAAAFIILALVVNSAIFTENLATRDSVAGSEEALEYRAEVVDSVGEMVVDANENGIEQEPDIALEYGELSERSGFEQALRGGVVAIDDVSTTSGQRIAQDNESRNLTSINNTADWQLADGVRQVRNVQFAFTAVDADGFWIFDEPFRMHIRGDSGSTWTVEVSDQFGLFDDEIGIRVNTPSESAQCVWDQDEVEGDFTVDVTGATVNGEPCHALERLSDGTEMWLGTGLTGPYEIEFENADTAEGTYSMVIDDGAIFENLHVDPSEDPGEPYYITDAIYSATLSYTYQTHAVAYETDIRVAPGEVPP